MDKNTQEDVIAVRMDENSEILYVTKEDLSEIITNETTKYGNEYNSMTDEEKEEFFANLIKSSSSEEERAVIDCTINYYTYKILRTFYIPDKVSKTIANWFGWFLRGAANVTWTFAKTTFLYMLNHWQIMLLLVSTFLFIVYPVKWYAVDLAKAISNKKLGIIVPTNTSEIPFAILQLMKGDGPISAVKLLYLTRYLRLFLGIFIILGSAYVTVDYIKELVSEFSKLEDLCGKTRKDPIVINKDMSKIINRMKNTNVYKNATEDMPSEKIKSSDFVQHVQKSVALTPINEIIKKQEPPQNAIEEQLRTPDIVDQKYDIYQPSVQPPVVLTSNEEYQKSIYKASVQLREESLKPQSDNVKQASKQLKSIFRASIALT
jgi:hypothetical protein